MLGQTNGTTPAALYALIPSNMPMPQVSDTPIDPLDLEEKLACTGIGGKTLEAFAQGQGLDTETAIERLAGIGIQAASGDKIKAIAEGAGTRPIEIAKALLIPGHAFESAQ